MWFFNVRSLTCSWLCTVWISVLYFTSKLLLSCKWVWINKSGKCSVYTLSVSQVILDLLAIIFTLKIIFLLSAAHSFYRLNVDALQLLYVTDLHSRVLITFLNEESFIGVVRCVEWMSGRGDDDMPQH